MTEPQSNLKDSLSRIRRERLHELLIAMIQQKDSFPLMDDEAPMTVGKNHHHEEQDPAAWLDRNRRVIKRYQAMVRSAVTLDAMLDAEEDSLKG